MGQTPEEYFPNWEEFNKYDVAIYPSNWGGDIIGAYQSGQLYLLDPAVELTTGLTAYYSFDSNADDDFASYDGTVIGADHDADGILSYAYDYVASNTDEIDIPNNYGIFTGSYASSVWIKTTDSSISPAIWQVLGERTTRLRIDGDCAAGKAEFRLAGGCVVCSTTTVNDGDYHHIVTNKNSTSAYLWVDGNLEDSTGSNCNLDPSTNNKDSSIGSNKGNAENYYDGLIDELAFYNKVLNTDEISALYNSGVGYNPLLSGTSPPFNMTAINLFNDSALLTFNATIDATTYYTTNGTLNTPLLHNSTSLHDFTVRAKNHFPVTQTNYNITTSGNYEAVMFMSVVNFACYEYITNNSLTCTNTTTMYPNAGVQNLTRNVAGYYPNTQEVNITPLFNGTLNFTDFVDSTLNITATNLKNGSSVSDFTIFLDDLDSSFNQTIVADGTEINKDLISGKNYSLFFTKTGFENKNVSLSNFSSQNYTFNVYEANSINITIRKESDLSLVLDTVTIRFSDENETITNYNTNTGYKYLSGFSPANYTISFISANYSTRTVNVNFDNNYQDLTVYLIASGSSNTIFTFQDRDDGSRIEGVTLSVQKLINTTWTLVESLTSDITGRTSFDYSTDVAYRFIATKENYLDKNWTLDPILFDSYIIKLDKNFDLEDNSDFNGITVYFVPKTFKEDTNTSINFTFSNPDADFVNYGFNATWDGVNYVTDSGSTGIGSNINATLEIVGSEMNDYVTIIFYYELSNGQRHEFTRTYIIQDSNTAGNVRDSLGNGYGLGLLERLLIVVMIALLVAGAGAYFGGALAGGTLAMLIFGIFSYTGFISWWLTLPSLIVMFIVATWRSSS